MCRFEMYDKFYQECGASFNTSYVSVREFDTETNELKVEFQYIICVGSSDIERQIALVGELFQYIICVGSSFG